MEFLLQSDYKPSGDQPQAIETLVAGIEQNHKHQVLLGITGSGKHFPWQCCSGTAASHIGYRAQ